MATFSLLRAFAPPLMLLLSGCQPVALADMPLHEKETAAAWEAFQKGMPEEAIKHADTCILEFRGAANRRQTEIDGIKERIPNGRVNAKQKEAIFKNGPLNDVATCYYIKARAADKLGQTEEVAKALTATAKYPAARAWDKKGFFWGPAQAAELYRSHPELADNSPHEVYTIQAWEELNGGRYAKAMELADKCVVEFYEPALEMEMDLVKRGVRLPSGAVSAATKQTIFENGLLNDVASCLFIKGKAAEATGNKKAAVAAYSKVLKLTRGRCWDPQGWFWSPAEGASDRLDILR